MNKTTVKRLRAIQREIKREPRRFFMDWWLDTDSNVAPCGTAACIGGWAVILDKAAKKHLRITNATLPKLALKADSLEVGERATKLLGISFDQSGDLFNTERWPEPYRLQFRQTRKGTREAAEVAIKRIDYFIKEGR